MANTGIKIALNVNENQLKTIVDALNAYGSEFPGPELRTKRNCIYEIAKILKLQAMRHRAGVTFIPGKGMIDTQGNRVS